MAQTKNLGIVRVVPKGDWTATTNYEYLNIVRYNGASYIAMSASLGIAPDATTGESYWQLISQDVSTAIQEQLNQNTEQIEINTKQISENTTDIALLTTIAEQNNQFYKATVEDAFTTRKTAGGLNLVNPSPATLLSVEGSTVAYGKDENGQNGTLKNAFFQGIKSTGKNLLNLNDYIESPTADAKAIGFDVTHLIVGKTYTFSTNAPFIKFFKIGRDWGSVNSVNTSSSTPFNTFTFTMARNSATPTGNLYLFVGETYKGMSSIEDFKPYFWQIEQGSTATTYEPYTENTLELPEAVECGLGTTIDFENKKIVNSGNTIVLTGEEAWQLSGYGRTETIYAIYFLGAINFSTTGAIGVITDGNLLAHQNLTYKAGDCILGINNTAFYIWNPIEYFGVGTAFADASNPTNEETSAMFAKWKAYLAQRYADGKPFTIRYVSSTSTETPFTSEKSAIGNEYTAHKDGSETVLGNSNEEFGAIPKETNQYYVLGGNPDESQV